MSCGLYGKLPMKRDFISVAVPPVFLDLWEPWLQGGITASRLALGPQWQDVFLRAPIWRFWLGSRLCGLPAMGSFMPSVDAVGRFFPLTAFACGEAGSSFCSPERDRQEEWFGGIEALLLGALDEDSLYEDFLAALDKLPAPQTAAAPEGAVARDLLSARMVSADATGGLEGAFSALLADRERRADEDGCFFWTIGGEGFPPAALFSSGLPDRHILTTLLSGEFSPSPALESHA